MNYATINGVDCSRIDLTVGSQGPWFADVLLADDSDVSGRVTIRVGELALSGTVDPALSGVFGLRRKVRVVAGAGGWGRLVPARTYHNDAGVKSRVVAQDAAREVGEEIGDFRPGAVALGPDYLREAGAASLALEDAAGGVPWWVDYSGVTHVAARPTRAATGYELLGYDPRTRVAELAVDDPRAIEIGSVLSERLDAPQTVRSLELAVTPERQVIRAWCGGSEASRGQLADVLREIARRSTGGRIWGRWRYRVVSAQGDRLALQVVNKGAGLPDAVHVSVNPGAPGIHGELVPGTIVAVEFLEGNRALPVVVGFPGADQPNHVPEKLKLAGGGAGVARAGDTVEVALPPAVFNGVIGGAPASGVLTFPTGTTLGAIVGHSAKVESG